MAEFAKKARLLSPLCVLPLSDFMRKTNCFLLFTLLAMPLWGLAQAVFEPNWGQWAEPFDFRLRLNRGTLYIDSKGISMNLLGYDVHHARHHSDSNQVLHGHTLRLNFVNTNLVEGKAKGNVQAKKNYLIGMKPDLWRSSVHLYDGLIYQGVYEGIDLEYSILGEVLKFNFIVHPGASPDVIQYKYEGADSLIESSGKLQIYTSAGVLQEFIPKVYQIINGKEQVIDAQYVLQNQIVSFRIGVYNPNLELVIDPQLVFSTFTGSTADNWGFTASYDNEGNGYVGGIVFSAGYPTTLGAYQGVYNGTGTDISITKFNPDGTAQVFSTLLGGSNSDQPQSLIVNSQNQLVVLGITGSQDFPVTAGCYQGAFMGGTPFGVSAYGFNSGTDLFVSILNSDGSGLIGSTYFGGTLNEGVNSGLAVNYADEFRSEVLIGANDAVYVASVTFSSNVPLTNAFQPNFRGWSDALLACFASDLQNMNWGTYYGGSVNDCAYGLDLNDNGSLYVVGGSRSADLQTHAQALFTNAQGASDGYILRLNALNGTFIGATYFGSAERDQIYSVRCDRQGNVYVFGQSFGSMPISPGVFSRVPGGQFLSKIGADLNQLTWSTVIGNGDRLPNLSPAALMVDDCYNIYISGWGGFTNNTGLGLIHNMPTTPDAFQRTTDSSDFYFMVLEPDARALLFASYFGGKSMEHVDGGTSRFSPDGTMYQAVCAGCSRTSFPTTPGVYGPNNLSANCNVGLIKIQFDFSIDAEFEISRDFEPDTICDTLLLRFNNLSNNANAYLWLFGNGQSSNQTSPIARFDSLGTYLVTLIAFDTICNYSDTATLIFNHTRGQSTKAGFTYSGSTCVPGRPLQFINGSENADTFFWDFGDGNTSNLENPAHAFSNFGTYRIRLTASNSNCFTEDSSSLTINIVPVNYKPELEIGDSDCLLGGTLFSLNGVGDSLQVFWRYGFLDSAYAPLQHRYAFPRPQLYHIRVRIEDSICNGGYVLDTLIYLEGNSRRLYIPTAFTPNHDKVNENFIIIGDNCFEKAEFAIYNRWGERIFYTENPLADFWDGSFKGRPAPEGLYHWRLRSKNEEHTGRVWVFH